jgi:thymidine phosphorylase
MEWIEAYTSGSLPDYQMSAFLMAGVLQGFTSEETQGFMEAMLVFRCKNGSFFSFSTQSG